MEEETIIYYESDPVVSQIMDLEIQMHTDIKENTAAVEQLYKSSYSKVNINVYSYSEPLTSGTALEILDNVFSKQYLQYTVMRINSRYENNIDVIVL